MKQVYFRGDFKRHLETLWQSSGGEDSVIPMQRVWVQPLVGELRSHMPCCAAKNKF